MATDYRTVTETTSTLISRSAHEMMYARYRWAAEQSNGKRVLEIGCGAGQGLNYLAGPAEAVVGADISLDLLREARSVADVDLVTLDATALPFRDGSFDRILLFEMMYYVGDVPRALDECRRVLSDDGTLLVVTANPERPDFNPSPFSHQYYAAHRLGAVLDEAGFSSDVLGNFVLEKSSTKQRAISLLRRTASRFNLIPKTMSGKTLLKRVVYGRLEAVSQVRDGAVPYTEPTAIGDSASRFQVLYATGVKKATGAS